MAKKLLNLRVFMCLCESVYYCVSLWDYLLQCVSVRACLYAYKCAFMSVFEFEFVFLFRFVIIVKCLKIYESE